MVQKYIAVLLVLTTLGITSPCMAGDFANLRPLMQTRLVSLTPHRATLGSMAGGLAFAPPQSGQSGQPQAQAARSNSGELTTGGKVMKWIGIGLIASGVAEAALGALAFKDDKVCAGSGSYSYCATTDNSSVRKFYYAGGGASVGIGAILLLVGLHKKQ